MCSNSGKNPFDKIQNKPNEFWPVQSGNVYGPDKIGYGYTNVFFYRANSPNLKIFGTCGTRFRQEMEIHAPQIGDYELELAAIVAP
jgi:hypothetical protein